MSSSSEQSEPTSAMSTTTIGSVPSRTRHRQGQIEHAYSIQRDAAIRGMLIWTLIGGSTVFMAHHLFPKFRSQTLAFKGFLTSGATIYGLCTGAEEVLQSHEHSERSNENLIRNKARSELGKNGIVATEAQIEKWRISEREKLLERLRNERNNSQAQQEV
ncbi:unnamed protein product [Sympodiomycopsis kandeliae]